MSTFTDEVPEKVDFKRKIITEITICRAAGIDDFTEDS